MNKQKAAGIFALMIFLLSGAVSLAILLSPGKNSVEIISDGKVLYKLDLSREKDREIVVEYSGRKNVIAVENGDIYMSSADCPDHTCIKTGRLSVSGLPIVCLPNKLIIRYSKNSGGDVDAVAG